MSDKPVEKREIKLSGTAKAVIGKYGDVTLSLYNCSHTNSFDLTPFEAEQLCKALNAKPDTPSADTKELVVALDWVLSDYEGMCTEGFPPSANWNRRVDSARKAIQALQPQGDKP